MNERLFVSSSPSQARQAIEEIKALELRELGEPGVFGPVLPGIPQSSMPEFITRRYVIVPFELQEPELDIDKISLGANEDARGDFCWPLASVSFSRTFSALHVQSMTQATYCVVREKNEATEQDELQLRVNTSLDTASLSRHESPENLVNQPLRDPDEMRRKMLENPLAAQDEIERLLNTPSIADLMLTDEQKRLLDTSAVGYREAELLINFMHGLYR